MDISFLLQWLENDIFSEPFARCWHKLASCYSSYEIYLSYLTSKSASRVLGTSREVAVWRDVVKWRTQSVEIAYARGGYIAVDCVADRLSRFWPLQCIVVRGIRL